MSDLPPDQSIEQTLASASSELWLRLFEAAHEYLAEPENTSGRRGERVMKIDVHGAFPLAIYTANVDEIVRLYYEIGIVHPFDWMRWDGRHRYRGRTALRTAPIADAARMATAVVRSERFSTGAIGAAIRDGTFSAILEQLLRWYDQWFVASK